MVAKVLDLKDIIEPDHLGTEIARKWHTWYVLKSNWTTEKEELRKYIYATDTTKTTNASLPWKNKTTIPKICQIRDNLFANYMASLFPKRKWLDWVASEEDSNSKEKREAILNYMSWVVSQPMFKEEISKIVLDYIDYGNVIGTVEWQDMRQERPDGVKVGYVGPIIRRISPLDIVFNPVAPSFIESPKIIRSLISMGELKKKLLSMSTDENREEYKKLFKYFQDYRNQIRSSTGVEYITKDEFLRVDGFTSWRSYVESDYCEILTFYGDLYDYQNDKFLENHQIMVVDRHKVIGCKPCPSYFGHPPIFHCGWRPRQDNLWAMGPLDNLVGLQYRIDHEENMKADILDVIAFPVLKIKGYVEDFEWKPMARIITSEDGDVEMVAPPFQVLQMNQNITVLMNLMEEMAGSPKEAMGFRTPGEKTAFEVQRLENAASRIYQQKITQFDEQFVERLMNGCLEMAARMISGPQEINVFDDEFKFQTFQSLTADDITGAGKLKPLGARHFVERSEKIQNLTNFFSSAIGQDQEIRTHFSSIKMARMLEELLDMSDYNLVTPYIRLAEAADAQKLAQAAQEQVMMEALTPAGLTPDDHNRPELAAAIMGNGGMGGSPAVGSGAGPAGPQAPQPGNAPGFNFSVNAAQKAPGVPNLGPGPGAPA